MKTSKALITIYKSLEHHVGKVQAKHHLAGFLLNVLAEIEDQNLEVSEEEIDKRLIERAEFIIKYSKDEVA